MIKSFRISKGLLYLNQITDREFEAGASPSFFLKPLQNKKGQKNLGYPWKKQSFFYKRTAFFSGTPKFFGPSYFEAALVVAGWAQSHPERHAYARSVCPLTHLHNFWCNKNQTKGSSKTLLCLVCFLLHKTLLATHYDCCLRKQTKAISLQNSLSHKVKPDEMNYSCWFSLLFSQWAFFATTIATTQSPCIKVLFLVLSMKLDLKFWQV